MNLRQQIIANRVEELVSTFGIGETDAFMRLAFLSSQERVLTTSIQAMLLTAAKISKWMFSPSRSKATQQTCTSFKRSMRIDFHPTPSYK